MLARLACSLLLFLPAMSCYCFRMIPRVNRLCNNFAYRSVFRGHGTKRDVKIRDDSANIVFKTRNWVRQWVSGYGLCPWAASMLIGERMKIAVLNHKYISSDSLLIDNVIIESKKLYKQHKQKHSPVETVLLVLSHNDLHDYLTYLDFIQDLESKLDRLGINRWIQVASFHPDYVFQGTDENSVENYTNRSPFPTVHLLLVSKVTEAIESYTESRPRTATDSETESHAEEGLSTDAIWKRNIALLQQMGIRKVSEIHRSIKDTPIKETPVARIAATEP